VRDTIYAEAKQRLVNEVGPQLRTISPRAVERTRLDNAVLMARRVYLTDLDAFDTALSASGNDLRVAVQRIIAAARADKTAPFDAVKRLATSPSSR